MATLSLHSLFELRTCIEKGTIMLDMEASTLPQVVGKLGVLDRWHSVHCLHTSSVYNTGSLLYIATFFKPKLTLVIISPQTDIADVN